MTNVITEDEISEVDFSQIRNVVAIKPDRSPDDERGVEVLEDRKLPPFVGRDTAAPVDTRETLFIRVDDPFAETTRARLRDACLRAQKR
jgi:hypothetical protein